MTPNSKPVTKKPVAKRVAAKVLMSATSTLVSGIDTATTADKKNIQKLQRAIIDALEDVKAQDIQVFDTEHITSLFERVIIASGTSNRQTKALAASVRDAVREAGFDKPRIEGEDNGEWIIVDCGAAVAHIMQPTIRQYYHLEELWGDKPIKTKLGALAPLIKKMAPDRQLPTAAVKTPAKKAAAKKAPAKKAAAKKAAFAVLPPVAPPMPAKKAARKASGAPVLASAPAVKATAKKASAKAGVKTAVKPRVQILSNTAAKTATKASVKVASKTATKTAAARKTPRRSA